MRNKPLLSVIVPVYNTKKFLPRCMESIDRQKYDNLEIILVDDGSSDGSSEMCDQYRNTRANVVVIHKENQGLGFARNSGLDVANGTYVTFLDSDDYLNEDMYSHLLMEITVKEAAAGFCDFCYVKKDGMFLAATSSFEQGMYSGKKLVAGMLGATPEAKADFEFDMSACKGIYLKSIIEENRIRFRSERETICEDLIFNLEYLLKAECVVYIKKSYYYYCENEGSLTHRYISQRLLKEKKLYEQVSEIMQDRMCEQDLLRFHRLFLARIRMTIRQAVYYERNRKMRTKLKDIQEVLEDELVHAVISNYPIKRNALKLRIFHTFLKWKFCWGIYILILLNR